MSAYRPYPKYKPSGVAWLGDVPEEWEVWKLAHAFTLIGSGTTPKTDNREYYNEGNIPWVNTGDLNDGQLLDCEKRITALAIAHHTSLKTYPAGSLLIAMYGATIGKLSMLRFPATVNQACCVFAGSSPITSKFMSYWFLGLRQQIISLATGGGQPNVSQDILRTLRVACPATEEQHQIASFLDRECGKLDALQAKQERLIELLKEKRQALISHAVTKGLNPTAKLKPSGIEWLGEVPVHWRVSRVKHVAKLESGHTPSKTMPGYWENCNIPWVSLNDTKQLKDVDYITETALQISELGMKNSSAHLLPERAVIFTRDATIGLAAITTRPMAVSQHIIAWICKERLVIPEFLLLVFYGMASDLERFTAGATLKTIGMPDVNKLSVATPPLSEQRDIVERVFMKMGSIDAAMAKASRGIELLKERRSALISAAVTGKIDVRDA